MSVREYGIDNYGLLLTEETLRKILKRDGLIVKDDEYYSMDELFDMLDGRFDADFLREFTGEAMLIDDEGFNCDGDMFLCEPICYLPLNRYPRLFSRAYKDMDEIVDELMDKLELYLPYDFNYKDNIRHIAGIYIG